MRVQSAQRIISRNVFQLAGNLKASVSHNSPSQVNWLHQVGARRRRLSSTSVGLQDEQSLGNLRRTTSDWREWFQSPEYRNAWSVDDVVPLEENQVLDRQSRFLLNLLNKLHQVSLTTTVDRVTTLRIHAMLQRLEDLPDKSSNAMWQKAERGRALLEAMELFEPLRREHGLPLELPLPTQETYWRVLRMYGSKYLHGSQALNRDVPQICLDIVQRMQDSQLLELQPTVLHWNYVLSAYANSSEEERPLKAAELLYSLDAKGLTDASSFSHTLRACVSMTARHQKTSPRFEQLGTMVAKRVWKGLKLSETIQSQPFHYVHMLRVGRNMKTETERDEFVKEIFEEATQARMINVHVLNEFLRVATPALVQKVLGKKNYSTDPLQLIRQIPSDWIESDPRNSNPYEW